MQYKVVYTCMYVKQSLVSGLGSGSGRQHVNYLKMVLTVQEYGRPNPSENTSSQQTETNWLRATEGRQTNGLKTTLLHLT